jgi:predicted O-linked N-acetylglucosamine transferase (SPINDLY family)
VELIRKAVTIRPQANYYNNLGIALKRLGRLEEAIAAYRAALQCHPDMPEALSNLGNLLCVTGRAAEAIAACLRAVELRPQYAEAHYNLGLALDAQSGTPGGGGSGARAAYERALALQPPLGEAHYHLGLIHQVEKHQDKALACFREAVRLRPRMAEAWTEIGVTHEEAGQTAEALQSYRQATAANPGFAPGWNNLGNLLDAAGQPQEAIAAFRQALLAAPDFPEAWCNLANALAARDPGSEAAAAYQKAISLRPDYAAAHNNLGALWRNLGKYPEAIACFEQALRHDPSSIAAMNNLGVALHAMQRYPGAIAVYRRALQLDSQNAELLNNLAAALNMTGDLDDALAASQRAVQLRPNHAGSHNNLANACKQRGELDQALASYRQALALAPDPVTHGNLLYLLHFHAGYDAAAILAEHQAWDRQHAAALGEHVARHVNDRAPDRRLRIGYVSPDFRNHPIARFLAQPLAAHDASAVEVFCYSDVIVPDAMTGRIRAASHHWRDIQGMPDAKAAELIRADRIDILIDLTMHMNANRMLLFARRPAPVQATYLAYCSTTGLQAMDYRISDPHFDPPLPSAENTDRFYSEKTCRLPASYWCYEAPAEAPGIQDPPLFANGFATFGCLNNFSKVSPEALACWREILRRVPQSRLLLHAHAGSHRTKIAQFFAQENISPDRLEFAALNSMRDYLNLYQKIDVALDPFPYGGGTTSCDALWMGVPIVTLRGRTGVGRGGTSILANLQLPQQIAESPGQYIELAAAMPQDPDHLRQLRNTLRDRMRASPLMDARLLAASLESAYRDMWNQAIG